MSAILVTLLLTICALVQVLGGCDIKTDRSTRQVPESVVAPVTHASSERQVGVHLGEQVPFYYKGMDEQMQDANCTVYKYERNEYKLLHPDYNVSVTLHCTAKRP